MSKLKVLELFGGIGACSKALEKLGIDYEIVDYVEIDKYAVKSFNAMHGTNFEPQDICEWDKDIECDLIMHGSPCQDFSLAGLQAGGDEGSGTRSSLMYETVRIVKKLKPKYVIWENVKNVISKKHRHNFDNYLNKMEELGYKNYWQVLNAKDYDIPQNRERVFTISIRNDLNQSFIFPEKQELKLKLKNMLEDNVDEKYYLSEKMIEYISATGTANFKNPDSKINLDIARPLTTDPNKKHQAGSIYDKNGLSPTLDTMQGGYRQPCIEDNNFVANKYNEFIQDNGYIPEMFNPYNKKEIKEIAPTQTTSCNSNTSSATILIKNATKRGYLKAHEGDSINLSYPTSNTRRGRVGEQVSQTLQCNDNMGVVLKSKDKRLKKIVEKTDFQEGEVLNLDLYNQSTNENISQCLTEPHHNTQRLFDGLRIRKLTPKECWRLMGFDDEDFEKASKVNSNTQLYKQAGNSIVVNVLMAIFKKLFTNLPN